MTQYMKYVKLGLKIAGFVLLMCAAYFVYDKLTTGENQAGNLMGYTEAQTQEAAESTQEPHSEDETQFEAGAWPADTPDFTVYTQDGTAVSLSSNLGKPVVLNFWASWCLPCKTELPDFQKAYEAYEDVVFMMVDMTDGVQETREKGMAYIKENGYTMPVYYDTEQAAAYAYSVNSIPMTFFISKDGKIVAYAKGMIDAEALTYGIENYIREHD